MRDAFGRKITYVRVSVTDRCNLRCLYCMPKEGLDWISHDRVLTYEEITRIMEAMADLGVYKIRITGGEPLVRAELSKLIRMLRDIPSIKEIALSTNAVLLEHYAEEIREAGVDRINVSLDTLDEEKFNRIARRRGLFRVIRGIEKAEQVGMTPIKINMVVMRGYNDDEIEQFARFTLERPWIVRFIELMPLHGNHHDLGPEAFVSNQEVLDRIRAIADIEPVGFSPGDGPARYFRFPNGKGNFGVISPLSHNFCEACNRVRLTAEGLLRLCLFGDAQIDLRTPVRQGATREELKDIILDSMAIKPERHYLVEKGHEASETLIGMSQVGG